MTQHSTFTAVPARPAPSHGRHGSDTRSAAPDSSVRPLLLTMVTTLTLAMVVIVLAATGIGPSGLDAGILFPV